MGQLKYPFIAGAAALMIACLLVSPHVFWRWNRGNEQIIAGLILGALATVVLYAVMRAIAARPEK